MRNFNVKLRFSGGDELTTTVKAMDKRFVLDAVKETTEYKDFEAAHPEEHITDTEISPVIYRPQDSNFYLASVSKKYYYVDHIRAGIRLEFMRNNFNKKQTVWSLYGHDTPDPDVAEAAVREIGKWLKEYFPEMLVKRETPPYDIIEAPNSKNIVACHLRLKEDTMNRIKEQAKEHDMTVSEYIEWVFMEER